MADGSARDRAIETVMAGVDPGCGCEVAAAGAAVDLLAARPAVLRALAGTPAEPLDVLALTAVLTEALEWEDSCIEWQGENDAAGVATFLASWLDAAGYTVTAAAPVAPGVAAEPTTDRVDVYVRARNVLRAGMRTAEVADGVTVDWQTDHHGVEHVVGVEVLAARGVEINGRDTQTGRPHGTGPEWKPNGSAPAGPPVAGPPAPAAEPTEERRAEAADWLLRTLPPDFREEAAKAIAVLTAAPAAVRTTRDATDVIDGLESVLYDLDVAAPELRRLVKRRICVAQEALHSVRAGAASDTAAEPRARAVADLIRKGLAHRLGITSLRPLDDADDLDWLLGVGRQIAALPAAPAHPGVARVLARCDEDVARAFHEAYERLAPEFGYRTRETSAKPWAEVPENNRALMVATVAAVRALLAGGEQP